MPARHTAADSAARAPTSLAPTASLLADHTNAPGAVAPAAAAPGAPGAAAPPHPAALAPLLLPTKSAVNLASVVARVVTSPSAIRERIGAVYHSGGGGPARQNSGCSNQQQQQQQQAAFSLPTDVPGLTAALGRAQREVVRLRDEVATLLSAASDRGAKEGQASVQALARARHDSVAAGAAREQAGRDLASLVGGAGPDSE